MLKSAFGGLSTGVCRQPQWVYVGVFMYSLAGCNRFYGILLPADYAPAWADSRSGFMSGCLCIHCPGGAGSTIGNMSYNSRGDALTTVYGFLRGLLMYLQPEYNCISRETVSYTSRGTIPHIVTNYPRAYIQRRTEHFHGCLQTPVLLYRPPRNTTAGSLCISKQNATISQAELYPILHARHYPSHSHELPSRVYTTPD